MGCAYLLLLGGKQLGAAVIGFFDLTVTMQVVWRWFELPITMALMTSFVMLVYRYLPSRRVGFRPLLAGAIPTVIAWMLLGGLFRIWLRHMGNFDEIYGGLTSFFLLMFLLWLISLVLLLGGEITARMAYRAERRNATDGKEKKRPQLSLRPQLHPLRWHLSVFTHYPRLSSPRTMSDLVCLSSEATYSSLALVLIPNCQIPNSPLTQEIGLVCNFLTIVYIKGANPLFIRTERRSWPISGIQNNSTTPPLVPLQKG
jgi:hypothetical protein